MDVFLFGEGSKNECVFLGCVIHVLFEHLHRTIKLYFNLAGTLVIIQIFLLFWWRGGWVEFFFFSA